MFVFLLYFQVVTCRIDSRDLSFAVFASQQTHEGVKLTNLIITVLRLKGQVNTMIYILINIVYINDLNA